MNGDVMTESAFLTIVRVDLMCHPEFFVLRTDPSRNQDLVDRNEIQVLVSPFDPDAELIEVFRLQISRGTIHPCDKPTNGWIGPDRSEE